MRGARSSPRLLGPQVTTSSLRPRPVPRTRRFCSSSSRTSFGACSWSILNEEPCRPQDALPCLCGAPLLLQYFAYCILQREAYRCVQQRPGRDSCSTRACHASRRTSDRRSDREIAGDELDYALVSLRPSTFDIGHTLSSDRVR